MLSGINKTSENDLISESQDYPVSVVPESERKGFFSILVVLLGFTFFSATMWAGGAVGSSFKFWPDLFIIVTGGSLILAVYVSVLSLIACKSGLNTDLMSRFCFGNRGAKWVDLLLASTQIGWYAWGTATIAIILTGISGLPEELNIFLMLIFGFAFCSTAFIGYRGLEKLSIISVPLMTALLFTSIFIALSDVGGINGIEAIVPTGDMAIAQAVTVVVGTFISGGTQVTNWTRFSDRPLNAVKASLIAFFAGNTLMLISGATGAIVYGESDIVEVLALQGLLLAGIILLFMNIWTTQDNTIYNFSIAGCNLFGTLNRRMITVAGAGAGTIIAILGMYDLIIPYMEWLGLLIPPVGGVIMADFFLIRSQRYPELSSLSQPDFNLSGILAYIAGCLVALFSPGIPPLNGIIFSIIAYTLFRKTEIRIYGISGEY